MARGLQTNCESEMSLFYECLPERAENVLDSADIVRDRDLCQSRVSRQVARPLYGLLYSRNRFARCFETH
jgi:hypothetical protein